MYKDIDDILKNEASLWGEYIMRTKGMPYWGKFDLKKYENSKQSTILSGDDTIVISSSIYHPVAFIEYQRKNKETFLLRKLFYLFFSLSQKYISKYILPP